MPASTATTAAIMSGWEMNDVRSRSLESLAPWTPTPEEVAAVLDEMRPIINRFASRDRRQLDEWAGAV
jgi:hypothetical protein